MEKADLKEHYRRDIMFHLQCARESVMKLVGELDMKNVEEVVEIAVEEDRLLIIDSAVGHGT